MLSLTQSKRDDVRSDRVFVGTSVRALSQDRWVQAVYPAPKTAPRPGSSARHDRHSHGGRWGSEVSRPSLPQDRLHDREVRNDLAMPLVLLLQLLQPIHLVCNQVTQLLAPRIAGEQFLAECPQRLDPRLALRYKRVDLPQLRDDLFWACASSRALLCPPTVSKAHFREDHSSGGKPSSQSGLMSGHIAPKHETACKAGALRISGLLFL